MNRAIVIAGPTAVGKTKISIELAKRLNADIISVDSAQVYRHLDIGTAKIRQEEMCGVKHYMIDVFDPTEKCNLGDFERMVSAILEEKARENKWVILVGGTGLYIDAITRGLSSLPPSCKKLREDFKNLSNEELYSRLEKLDKEALACIHLNNRNRLERALEVCMLTGDKFSVLSKQNKKNNSFTFTKVALERDRKNIYERIDKRVDIMMEEGLLDEVRSLYSKYGDYLNRLNVIGYNELIAYLDGKYELQEAISAIKKNSRHYAKRQFTWFKNDEYIWYNLDIMSEKDIINSIILTCLNT